MTGQLLEQAQHVVRAAAVEVSRRPARPAARWPEPFGTGDVNSCVDIAPASASGGCAARDAHQGVRLRQASWPAREVRNIDALAPR
jgi:hypothetical protein